VARASGFLGRTTCPSGAEASLLNACLLLRHLAMSLVTSCQVCDQPHPAIVRNMLTACSEGDLQKAYTNMKSLCDMGYSAVDIITTVFKVSATHGAAVRLYMGWCLSMHNLKL
jgi:hypothetical protein